MNYSKRYDPKDHDTMLYRKWKRGLDDYEVSADFQRQGLDFSSGVVRKARIRLGLKANKEWERACETPVRIAASKRDPLAVAQEYLPGFDREAMTLDGRPIRLDDAIGRTNLVLKGLGLAQLDAKPGWVR